MTPAPREDMRAEASFVWLTKAALRRIDEAPTIRSPAAAKLVYLALCWLASDAESNTFTAAIANIATKASLGYRST